MSKVNAPEARTTIWYQRLVGGKDDCIFLGKFPVT